MGIKRTRSEKIQANLSRVNRQLGYTFEASDSNSKSSIVAKKSDNLAFTATIKHDLIRSLITAILILSLQMVLYWFS